VTSCAGVEPAVAFHRLQRGGADVPAHFLERGAPASFARVVERRYGVDVVGSDRQRDLRELRTVQQPIDLDRRDVADEQPRQRDATHIVVAGGGNGRVDAARQRGECVDDAHVVLEGRDLPVQRGHVGRGQGLDRETREREAGNVDLLYRHPRIPEPVERRLRHEFKPGLLELFKQGAERSLLIGCQLFEVSQ